MMQKQDYYQNISPGSMTEKEQFRTEFQRRWGPMKVSIYVALMVFSFWVQSHAESQTLRGVVAQFQVVLSVFLVLSLPKYGYMSVLAVTGTEVVLIFWRIAAFQD